MENQKHLKLVQDITQIDNDVGNIVEIARKNKIKSQGPSGSLPDLIYSYSSSSQKTQDKTYLSNKK